MGCVRKLQIKNSNCNVTHPPFFLRKEKKYEMERESNINSIFLLQNTLRQFSITVTEISENVHNKNERMLIFILKTFYI